MSPKTSAVLFVITSLLLTAQIDPIDSANGDRKLSRRKRYVVFPEGSTLSVAICMTVQTIMRPSEIFTEGLNWGISYDLPNSTASVKEFLYPRHVMQRRHRRDLYQKMELIMDSMGYNGRSCIYRALCEAGGMFGKRGNNVIEEILRIVFRFPQQKVLHYEPKEHDGYKWAHGIGKTSGDEECAVQFSDCPFSLIDFALGHYGLNEFPFSM